MRKKILSIAILSVLYLGTINSCSEETEVPETTTVSTTNNLNNENLVGQSGIRFQGGQNYENSNEKNLSETTNNSENALIETDDYLCFEAEESNVSMWIQYNKIQSPEIEYSYDKKYWNRYKNELKINLNNIGDKVYFRGDNTIFKNNFVFTNGKIAASGNIMSLIDKTCQSKTLPSDSCFYSFFRYGSGVTSAPKLPALNLTPYCYCNMFENCSMTNVPQLPASDLKEGCYSKMFSNCSLLTKTPELNATKLAEKCYLRMFEECTSLTDVCQLNATILANKCYYGMFKECSSLTSAPELNSTSLAESCYAGMFEKCYSLQDAPKLPAKKLFKSCYSFMFSECSSLSQAPDLMATELAEYCYSRMFKGCINLNYIKIGFLSWNNLNTSDWLKDVSSSGTFVCKSSLDKIRGTSYIPDSWNVKTY